MNYLNAFKALLMLLVFVVFTQTSYAQEQTSRDATMAAIKAASETSPKTFTYRETPAFCFGRSGRNPFVHYTPEQIAVLKSYDYPEFTSKGSKFLESDIVIYKQALKDWEIDNKARTEEIRAKLKASK